MAQVEPIEEKPQLGRKRDHTRDPEILEAALDVLAETGYEGMTIEMVAAQAKAGKATLYRRWASKAELVVDAVTLMKSREIDLTDLPDTGTLRGDLVAMIKSPSLRDNERKLKVMAGIVSMIARSPELAAAVHGALIQPRVAADRILFERARTRGEITEDCDIEMLCTLAPALVAYRVLMLRLPLSHEFLISSIDSVVLPAAGVRRTEF